MPPTTPAGDLTEDIRSAIHGLMLADNLGDVHEEVDRLRAAIDLAPLQGDYLTGWEPADWVQED